MRFIFVLLEQKRCKCPSVRNHREILVQASASNNLEKMLVDPAVNSWCVAYWET